MITLHSRSAREREYFQLNEDKKLYGYRELDSPEGLSRAG